MFSTDLSAAHIVSDRFVLSSLSVSDGLVQRPQGRRNVNFPLVVQGFACFRQICLKLISFQTDSSEGPQRFRRFGPKAPGARKR